MSCRPILRDDPQQTQSNTFGTTQLLPSNGEPRPADVEMARVLKTAPVSMASDPASGAIAHWKHGALHDVVEPMADHVVMMYPTGVQRLERRNGKSIAIGTARSASASKRVDCASANDSRGKAKPRGIRASFAMDARSRSSPT